MKTRVTAGSSRYPAQNVEWILIFFLFFWTPMEWGKKIPLGRQDLQD